MSKLNLKLDNWVISRLAEPFPVEELKWLPAFGIKEAGKPTAVLAYVDARMVVDRLNTVIGAENWSDEYETVSIETTAVNKKDKTSQDVKYGGIQCTLTILGVSKSDVGMPSFSDELKGAYSDSLKRAAVKFGVGEYFYRMGTQFAKFDAFNKVTEAPRRLPDFAIPVERPDADKVIQKLISDALAGVSVEHRDLVEGIVSHAMAMGSYNPNIPLVVKRAIYEELTKIVNR